MDNNPFNQPVTTPVPDPTPSPAPDLASAPIPVAPVQPIAQPAPVDQPIFTTPPVAPKKSKTGLIIGIIVGAVVLIGGGLTAGLLVMNNQGPKAEDYRKAYKTVADFAEKQANIQEVFGDAVSEAQYDPDNLDEYAAQIDTYVANFRTMMSSIEGSGVLKDEALKEKYDKLKELSDKILPAFDKFLPELQNFTEFYTNFKNDLQDELSDGEALMGGILTDELIDEVFAPIAKSKNAAIKQFSDDMTGVLKQLGGIIRKYNSGELSPLETQTQLMKLSTEMTEYASTLTELFTAESLMGITEADLEAFDAAGADFINELYGKLPSDDQKALPKTIDIMGSKS